MSDAGRPLRMLTFAPMVNSECGRLILRHYGAAFDEQDHLLGLANLCAILRGGYGALPFTHGRGVRLSSTRPLVEHFAPRENAPRLRPPTEPLRQHIDADFRRFNGDLASNVAVIAYYHLLPLGPEMKKVFAVPLPAIERLILPVYYPLLRSVLGLLLRFNPPRIADAVMRVRLILDQADARLADGRAFLHGRERTLSDLALASALAPLVIPAHYAAQMPPEELLPEQYRALIAETRARPCAAHLRRVYAALGV